MSPRDTSSFVILTLSLSKGKDLCISSGRTSCPTTADGATHFGRTITNE
jgi:hypothetical protein